MKRNILAISLLFLALLWRWWPVPPPPPPEEQDRPPIIVRGEE